MVADAAALCPLSSFAVAKLHRRRGRPYSSRLRGGDTGPTGRKPCKEQSPRRGSRCRHNQVPRRLRGEAPQRGRSRLNRCGSRLLHMLPPQELLRTQPPERAGGGQVVIPDGVSTGTSGVVAARMHRCSVDAPKPGWCSRGPRPRTAACRASHLLLERSGLVPSQQDGSNRLTARASTETSMARVSSVTATVFAV